MSSQSKLSTFEKEMQNATFRKKFNKAYKKFLLSEIICAMMENDVKSVRKLAKEVGLSPTIVQNIRSGKQQDVKLLNFINISHACGYELVLEKGTERILL
jgi:hypothetical protein